jgi:hypothetical protein
VVQRTTAQVFTSTKATLKSYSNTLNLTIALPRLINIATFNKSSSKADLNLNRIVSLMQELQNSMLRGNVTPSKSVASTLLQVLQLCASIYCSFEQLY